MNEITTTIHPAILRYASGEISASHAAHIMGGDATVHDVIYQWREAGLPWPPHMQAANPDAIARALKLLAKND